MADKSAARFNMQGRIEHFDLAAEEAALARVRALARIMDSAITIPGSSVSLGVDAVLGLIPVVGDVLSQVISSYIIWEARKLGISRLTIGRMIANSLLDTVVGAVPMPISLEPAQSWVKSWPSRRWVHVKRDAQQLVA